MNPETGRVYRDLTERQEALDRGERLVDISEEVAAQQEVGQEYLRGLDGGAREFAAKWFAVTPKERAREMQAIRKSARSKSGKKRIRKVGIR